VLPFLLGFSSSVFDTCFVHHFNQTSSIPLQILLIDNYDSFVHNLARYFERLGQRTVVVRNDAASVTSVRAMRPAAVVLSPGPCTPSEAGCSLEIVRELHAELPILGICLGHQAIVQALGGKIVRAATPVHGRTSHVHHDGRGVFEGLPNPITAGRYHSLVAEECSLPPEFEISARSADGTIMAVRQRRFPVVGLQFHPESILTEHGFDLLHNFLRLSGDNHGRRPACDDELAAPPEIPLAIPLVPVPFFAGTPDAVKFSVPSAAKTALQTPHPW
jgi:anthranilate synthase/aminodeoxychorismate synthase-like glutamine amidotransferase